MCAHVCMHANEHTCLPQGEVILALYWRWQSVLAGGGCAAQRRGALVQRRVVRGPVSQRVTMRHPASLGSDTIFFVFNI